MPRLLRDIVIQSIERESDMSIVGEAGGREDVDDLLRETRAEVLVFEDESAAAPCTKEQLVRDHASVKVLVVSEHGRSAELHWLEPRTIRCTDLSPDRLVELIRASFVEKTNS